MDVWRECQGLMAQLECLKGRNIKMLGLRQINSKMHRKNPSLAGKDIREIKPVKFGGSPADFSNKIPLTRKEHSLVTNWWKSY